MCSSDSRRPAAVRQAAISSVTHTRQPSTGHTRKSNSTISPAALAGHGTDLLDEADPGLMGGRERRDVEGGHAGLAEGGQALGDVALRADERDLLDQFGGH